MSHILLLFIAGLIGGAINAIAGGGGIIMYPVLLAVGLPPIIANTTSSLVVWPGSLTSAYGFRKDLRKVPRSFLWLAIPCLFGSLLGSYILIHTNPTTFERLAPWLILSAVALLALQSRIHKFVMSQTKTKNHRWQTLPLVILAAFPLALYGGYFGAGFGLMMLALLGFSGLKNIYQMNGVKNLTGAVMAVVATIYFWHAGLINWPAGLTMAVGTTIGGYTGSRLTHRISAHLVHDLTVAIGLIISLVLLLKLSR